MPCFTSLACANCMQLAVVLQHWHWSVAVNPPLGMQVVAGYLMNHLHAPSANVCPAHDMLLVPSQMSDEEHLQAYDKLIALEAQEAASFLLLYKVLQGLARHNKRSGLKLFLRARLLAGA